MRNWNQSGKVWHSKKKLHLWNERISWSIHVWKEHHTKCLLTKNYPLIAICSWDMDSFKFLCTKLSNFVPLLDWRNQCKIRNEQFHGKLPRLPRIRVRILEKLDPAGGIQSWLKTTFVGYHVYTHTLIWPMSTRSFKVDTVLRYAAKIRACMEERGVWGDIAT